MKRIAVIFRSILFLFSLLVISYSCCSKRDCIYMENGFYSLSLNGFDYSEIDTIEIVKYPSGDDFTHPIDSFEAYSGYYYTNYDIYLPEQLIIEYDYVIKTGYKSYRLNEYRFNRFKCNSCFLGFSDDYYYNLSSYMLNGVRVYNNILYIDKNSTY